MDPDAAALLHRYLSGYATLRKFYELRDAGGQGPEEDRIQPDSKAAKCLIAVISSAADNICGGLYDASRDCVIQVDGLLSLLGEATVFVNRTSVLVPCTSSLPARSCRAR